MFIVILGLPKKKKKNDTLCYKYKICDHVLFAFV